MFGVGCIKSRCSQCFRWRGLGAVIRVAGQNSGGPVNLFQKHDANHLVRPSGGTERNSQSSPAPQIGRKSVRAADHENSIGDRIVPPAAKMAGKSAAVDVVAALIQRHQHGFFGNRGRNRGGFLRYPGGGVAAAIWAIAGKLMPAKPADSSAMESGMRSETG